MYLDLEFKLVNGWRTPRWARWAVNPTAPPEARAAIDRLLAINRTIRRLSWIVIPLQLARALSAAFAVVGGFVGLFGILFGRLGVLFFWHRWELDDESLVQQISDSPFFWPIVGAAVLAVILHGVVRLIIGPVEGEKKALIEKLVSPDFKALRPTPRIEEFNIPERVSDKLAWETAELLVAYDRTAVRSTMLGDVLAKHGAYHLTSEEKQRRDDRQGSYDRKQARRAELATQIADSFRAAELPIGQEQS